MDTRNPTWFGPSDSENESQEELNEALDQLDDLLPGIDFDSICD